MQFHSTTLPIINLLANLDLVFFRSIGGWLPVFVYGAAWDIHHASDGQQLATKQWQMEKKSVEDNIAYNRVTFS